MKIYQWTIKYSFSGAMEWSLSEGLNSTRAKAEASLEKEKERLSSYSVRISREYIEEIEID